MTPYENDKVKLLASEKHRREKKGIYTHGRTGTFGDCDLVPRKIYACPNANALKLHG